MVEYTTIRIKKKAYILYEYNP